MLSLDNQDALLGKITAVLSAQQRRRPANMRGRSTDFTLDSLYVEFYNGQTWDLGVKELIAYDTEANTVTTTTFRYDQPTTAWEPEVQQIDELDANGQLVASEYREYDDSLELFQIEDRFEIEFVTADSGSVVFYAPMESGGDLMKVQKADFKFDGNLYDAKMTKMYVWESLSQSWILASQLEQVENEDGQIVEEIVTTLSESTFQFENDTRTVFTYDANGYMIEEEAFYWDADSSRWEKDDKVIFTVDANGDVLTRTQYNWFEADTIYLAQDKESFVYDNNENPEEEYEYNWIEGLDSFVLDAKYVHSYNYDVTLEAVKTPEFYTFMPIYQESIVNMPTGYTAFYTDQADSLQPSERGTYYYTAGAAVDVADLEASEVRVYPNPVGSELRIDNIEPGLRAQLQLFSLDGRLIAQYPVQAQQSINVEQLQAGAYIYRLIAGEQLQSGRLIKQ